MTDQGRLSEHGASSAVVLCRTNGRHEPTDGTVAAVADAVRRGADLRRFSTYNLRDTGRVEETMTLQTTWVFDDMNVGGLQTLRHPLNAALGIATHPCMALWIFGVGTPQRSTFVPLDGNPMQQATHRWVQVNNDAYGEEADDYVPARYQWWARFDWEQICVHDENGDSSLGSWKPLAAGGGW